MDRGAQAAPLGAAAARHHTWSELSMSTRLAVRLGTAIGIMP
jgi:hypothetical protein